MSFFGFFLEEMGLVVFLLIVIDDDDGGDVVDDGENDDDDDDDDGEREEGEECFLYESAADAIKFFSAAGDKSDVEQ